jgi:hypothetical protein
MNKKSIVIGAVALILGGLAMSPGAVEAYQGDPGVQGPRYTAERHEAMEQAFENNDYNAWKKLMSGKSRVTQGITKENFARFAEAHKLAEAGNIEGAKAIRQELGLGQGNRGQGTGRAWNR